MVFHQEHGLTCKNHFMEKVPAQSAMKDQNRSILLKNAKIIFDMKDHEYMEKFFQGFTSLLSRSLQCRNITCRRHSLKICKHNPFSMRQARRINTLTFLEILALFF